jgi:hypothetical protein
VTLTAIVGLLAQLAPAPAGAATPCGERVLVDWWNDGRIDRVYALHCYQNAIDRMPADIRDYTDAAEVIDRALQSAVRNAPPSARARLAADAGPSSTSRTALVLALAGGTLVLLLAAALSWLARRGPLGRTPPRR